MATQIRESLNALNMDARVYCAGCAYVGIRVSGTFVGTLTPFMAQYDPTSNAWQPQTTSVFPWPGAGGYAPGGAGTLTSTITAAGNYFWPAQSAVLFGLQLTSYTSGSAVVSLAASLDNSWATAFLPVSGATGQYRNSIVGGSQNIMTIPADTNLSRRLVSLVISAAQEQGAGSSSGPTTAFWGAYPALKIFDGDFNTGTLIWSSDLNTTVPFQYTVPLPASKTDSTGISDDGLVSTPGNAITIVLSSPGAGIITSLNAEVGY